MSPFVRRGDITREVSALISCIAQCCVYMKFPLNIKDSTFFSQFWKNIGFWDVIYEILDKYIGNTAKS